MTPYPRLVAACLLICAVLAPVVSAQGEGNQRGLDFGAAFAGESSQLASRPFAVGPLSLGLDGTLNPALNGSPTTLFVDVQDLDSRVVMDLPMMPGVLGLGPGFVALVDGVGVSGAPEAGALLTSGTWNATMPSPDPAALPARLVVGMQALALDGTAPYGLALSPTILLHGDLQANTLHFDGQAAGRDAIMGYGTARADLDLDGLEELLVGIPRGDASGVTDAGEVHLMEGNPLSVTRVFTAPIPLPGAWFGASVASGDLNGDGLPDVAVGAPHEDEAGVAEAGAVHLLDGITGTAIARLVADTPEAGADFGEHVMLADWNGDGALDVVVGSPRATSGGESLAGRVFVFVAPAFGTPVVLDNPYPQAGARFGYALAHGDLDGDGSEELVLPAPYHDAGAGDDNSGVVHVYPGGGTVPTWSDWHALDARAFHGAAVEVADMNGDGHLDLVIAAEFEDVALVDDGAVHVLYGPDFVQRTLVSSPAPENDGGFGSGLAVGDANRDGLPDLAVGEFHGDVNGFVNAGRGWAIYGPSFTAPRELQPSDPAHYAFAGRRMAWFDPDGDGWAQPVLGAPYASPGGPIWRLAGSLYIYR